MHSFAGLSHDLSDHLGILLGLDLLACFLQLLSVFGQAVPHKLLDFDGKSLVVLNKR
jgi:hypothetical protein